MAGPAQLLPGTLDLLSLRAVSLGPLHAYGVLPRIGQISGNAPLSLFRLVRQGLQKASWRTSENNRRAKFYELTKAGQRQVKKAAAEWEETTAIIARFLVPAEEG